MFAYVLGFSRANAGVRSSCSFAKASEIANIAMKKNALDKYGK